MTQPDPTASAWCEPDGCPGSVCNGPHVSHHCPNGDLVVTRFDDPTPCPGCGVVTATAAGEPPSAAGPDPDPEPVIFTPADRQELEALESRANDLNLELRTRGGSMPLGPVRLEALIDFLFGDETPERLRFELHFRRNQVAILEQGIAQAIRQDLMRGVRGPANGRPHGN